MQTNMKAPLYVALMLAAGTATAQQLPSTTTQQVPAITSALDASPPPASATPLPATPAHATPAAAPSTTATNASYQSPAPLVVPAPIKHEEVSPRVARARERFDAQQRAQVAEYIAEARQVPTSSTTANVGSQTVFTYRPGALFTVYVGAGRITDIALQPGEQITGEVQGGDTVRWMIAQVNSGSGEGERTHVILKAIDAGLTTDLFIPTNRRSYLITARSVADWHMPSVSWQYPMDTWKQQQAVAARRESVIPVAASPESLNFNYTIDSPRRYRAWRPLQVFDDGKQTYIRMPPNLNATDAPALFIIENREPLLVNYRVRGVADGTNGPTYVVDRVFDRAELRVGAKQAITIRRR